MQLETLQTKNKPVAPFSQSEAMDKEPEVVLTLCWALALRTEELATSFWWETHCQAFGLSFCAAQCNSFGIVWQAALLGPDVSCKGLFLCRQTFLAETLCNLLAELLGRPVSILT